MLRKYFLAKLFVPLIKGSVFPQFYVIFGKLNFWRKINRRWPYKNGEKFVLSSFLLRKYFLAKLFIWHIKRSVSPQFYAIFGKLNFWRTIDRRGSYKNSEHLNYLKLCKENIFCQNYLFHSSRKCSSTILGNFEQIEFLKEYWQARTLRKSWKFVLS